MLKTSKTVSQLASFIDDLSRKDGIVGKCVNILAFHSLAEKLWSPFKTICFAPAIVFVVLLIVYILFAIIYLPLWLLSFVITIFGSVTFLMVMIHFLAILVSRTIAFPGYSMQTLKQLSSDFIKRIFAHLFAVAKFTAECNSRMLAISTGKVRLLDNRSALKGLNEISTLVKGLPRILHNLKFSTESLSKNNQLVPEEFRMFTQLWSLIEEFIQSVAQLTVIQPVVQDIVTGKIVVSMSGSLEDYITSADKKTPTFQAIATMAHCLRASELLKTAIRSLVPEEESKDDEGMVSKLMMLFNFSEKLVGIEKLTLPFMKNILKLEHQAEFHVVRGKDNNFIDSAFIPCRGAAESGKASKGLVLMCNPNACYFECYSQQQLNQSWMGFYFSLGYDICVFNYRGYGSSTGAPSPDAVKRDAVAVLEYMRAKYLPERVLVHGESIGGMVACHVARHCTIQMLVCDRTFASLDATACRLLGNWAGAGLRYLSLWKTSVVNDFLLSSCPKIVLQDPNDEIVRNVSGLKNGVALFALLNDSVWNIEEVAQEYVVAQYLQEPLPNQDKTARMLSELNNVEAPLPPRLLDHLYCCLVDVWKKIPLIEVSSNSTKARYASHDSKERLMKASADKPKVTPLEIKKAAQDTLDTIDLINKQGNVIPASPRAKLDTEGGSGVALVDNVIPLDDAKATSQHSASPPTTRRRYLNDSNNNSSVSIGYSQDEEDPLGTGSRHDDELDESSHHDSAQSPKHASSSKSYTLESYLRKFFSSAEEFLNFYCAINVQEDEIGLVAYNATTLTRTPVSMALTPYAKLWIALTRMDGGSGELLGAAMPLGFDGFRAWLCCLLAWIPAIVAADRYLPKHRTTVSECVRDVSRIMEQASCAALQADSSVLFIRDALLGIERRMKHAESNELALAKYGYLVPLHCGHNGWPGEEELTCIAHNIAKHVK